MKVEKKLQLRQKRCWRIRKKVNGTLDRPRLALAFTNKHIYAQCIDDTAGRTLAFLSTLSKELKDKDLKANIAGSIDLAKSFGDLIKNRGITSVVLSRAGRRYHGVVKAFADTLREAGIAF